MHPVHYVHPQPLWLKHSTTAAITLALPELHAAVYSPVRLLEDRSSTSRDGSMCSCAESTVFMRQLVMDRVFRLLRRHRSSGGSCMTNRHAICST